MAALTATEPPAAAQRPRRFPMAAANPTAPCVRSRTDVLDLTCTPGGDVTSTQPTLRRRQSAPLGRDPEPSAANGSPSRSAGSEVFAGAPYTGLNAQYAPTDSPAFEAPANCCSGARRVFRADVHALDCHRLDDLRRRKTSRPTCRVSNRKCDASIAGSREPPTAPCSPYPQTDWRPLRGRRVRPINGSS